MRIALVSHHFLPRHRAGVEVYTDGVARELQRRGLDVCVITTDDAGTRIPFRVQEDDQDGLPVFSIAHPRVARGPDDSLGYDEVLAESRAVLSRFEPDVVHFQHLMYVGLEAPKAAREVGVPSLMTLHEYWLLCARGGQMRQADGTLCESAELDQCARCLTDFRFGRTPGEARIAAWCARLRRITGWDPFPMLKRIQQRRSRSRDAATAPDETAVAELRTWLESREIRVRGLLDHVDRFLCPSNFLRDQFIRAGWPAERLVYSPNGVGPLEPPPRRPREPSDPLRIGFMGSIVPQKGPDVLARAHGMLPRARATLALWGSTTADPDYAAKVEEACVPGEANLRGTFPGGRAVAALAEMDVLVVPSVWYENAPLVISEAFACGVPVVASRLGGMAEMVDDGRNGRLFEHGSAEDLARVLLELIEQPKVLAKLAAGVVQPRTLADDVDGLVVVYEELAGSRG